MAIPRPSFSTQANALVRKNLIFQRRNTRSNCCLVIFPVLLCILLSVLQRVIDNELSKEKFKCGCAQVNGKTECGIQYSTLDQASSCPIPDPQKWPALLQVPDPQSRAVKTNGFTFPGLPSESCRQTGTCPVTVLVTGNNRTLRQGLAWKSLVVEAKFRKRANTRTESDKLRNRRWQKKYDGTSTKPRLSVFCSDKQLYAMLVDDVHKKCLFYGSTLQKSVRSGPDVSIVEAAKAVGEELVKAAINLSIDEISSYDRNGSVRGERVKAFEIALSEHGFLLR